jgi:hypothetical protein
MKNTIFPFRNLAINLQLLPLQPAEKPAEKIALSAQSAKRKKIIIFSSS